MDCSELFTTFLHWSVVIPERELQLPAFWQTDPAMSLPAWWQPLAPTANIPTASAVDKMFRILDPSLRTRDLSQTKNHGNEGRS